MKKQIRLTLIGSLFILLLVVLLFPATSTQAASRKLNITKKTIYVSKTLNIVVSNKGSNDKISWSSSNTKVATVSSKGVVKGIAPGDVKITSKITSNGKNIATLTCKVTVSKLVTPIITDYSFCEDGDIILGDSSGNITFTLDKTVVDATITIKNSEDSIVKTIDIGTVNKNKKQTISWDGTNSKGNLVNQDLYYAVITAGGANVTTETTYVYETSEFAGGNGSEKNPYKVSNTEQFKAIVRHNGKYFIQTDNIDFNYETITALFTSDLPFTGCYDGNNLKISNYIGDKSLILSVGENGILKNLVIENGMINAKSITEGYELALLTSHNYGTITDCSANGTVVGSDNCAVLVAENFGSINRCSSSGEVKATYGQANAGGLVSLNLAGGKIMNSFSTANVSAISTKVNWNYYGAYAAGVVAINYGSVISCHASGTLIATPCYDSEVGLGGVVSTNNGIVQNCYYDGPTQCNQVFNGSGSLK